MLESIGKNTADLSKSGGDQKKNSPKTQQQTQEEEAHLQQQPAQERARGDSLSKMVTASSSGSVASVGLGRASNGVVMLGANGRNGSKKKLNLSLSTSLIQSASVRCLDDIEGDEIADLDDLVGSRSQAKDPFSL